MREFITDMETAKKVGSRHGRPVIYQIDCAGMVKDGLIFYLSANKVWLTKAVPVQYLRKVEELRWLRMRGLAEVENDGI